MDVVDMFFSWGNILMHYFTLACEWFSSPNAVVNDFLIAVCEFPVFGHIFSAMGVSSLIGLSPIDLIMGPGLVFFLSLKLASFVVSVIKGVFSAGMGVF